MQAEVSQADYVVDDVFTYSQLIPHSTGPSSPKRKRCDDDISSSSRASFWELDCYGREARAESAISHLYSDIDASHFKSLNHAEEFRVMQQAWAEVSSLFESFIFFDDVVLAMINVCFIFFPVVLYSCHRLCKAWA